MSDDTTKERVLIGRVEKVTFPLLEASFYARIDTGATYSSLWGEACEVDGGLSVTFFGGVTKKIFPDFSKRVVQSSMGHIQTRYTVKTPVVLKGRRINATFTVADRSKQTYPVLIGRNVLMNKFHVDVSKGSARKSKERETRRRLGNEV